MRWKTGGIYLINLDRILNVRGSLSDLFRELPKNKGGMECLKIDSFVKIVYFL